MALIVCFIPRILVGIVPYFVYKALDKLFHKKFKILTFTVAGIAGSLTNTLLVMNGIYFIFKDSYALVKNVSVDVVYSAVVAVILTNGVPEAIVAGVVTAGLCRSLMASKQVRDMIS